MVATSNIGSDELLARMLAHEVRQPLNTILLTAEWALRSPDPRETQTALREIVSEVRIGAKMVTEIESLSDPSPRNRPRIDIQAVIRDTVKSIDRNSVPPGVKIQLSPQKDLLPVHASPTAIREVLMNLIENAVAAITERGSVIISSRSAGDQVEIAVQDDGSGIAPRDMPRIFDPFFTTKSDRGGTGLGLAICRRLLAAQGGTIEVSSHLGRGSCFCVRLPVTAKDRDEIEDRFPAALEGTTAPRRCVPC